MTTRSRAQRPIKPRAESSAAALDNITDTERRRREVALSYTFDLELNLAQRRSKQRLGVELGEALGKLLSDDDEKSSSATHSA
jgi:hypothetical protein